ncbi:MAG: hypothetical protein HYT34_01040 [Candidatus Ryanbacteria bacterium]|nr:hypothetical protein [Candidatus Ryanbacteria bacterium]
MFYILHSNRWLVWAIVAEIVASIIVLWQIQLYSTEQDAVVLEYISIAASTRKSGVDASVPLSTSTSGWKTYRNEKYGFEFKYPASIIVEFEDEKSIVLSWQKSTEEHATFSVGVDQNPQSLSLKDYYDGNPGRDLFSQTQSSEITRINVENHEAYKFIPYITFAGEVDVVISRKGSFIKIIDNGSTFQANGLFDTILSTFKFLN